MAIRMAQKAGRRHLTMFSARTAGLWLLSSFLLAGCGTTGARRAYRPESSSASLPDGEVRLEKVLHELDMLDAELYPFKDAPGHPIDTCIQSNREVAERALAWRLTTGKTAVGQEKAAEKAYYVLLQQGTPAELIPLVHLKKYYQEGLRRCVLGLDHGTPREAQEESSISILSTANFEAETTKGVVVIDFMTHWCGPCKEMAPDLEKLARDYKGKLKVGRLNVDRNMDTAQKFHPKVLPTLVVLENGREVARLPDGHTYAELKVWIDRVLQERATRKTGSD